MSNELTHEQEARALEALREYITAPSTPDARSSQEAQGERDRQRIELINKSLRPLVELYLQGRVPLQEFKAEIDGINKRHNYWGFKGIKGQMFFNMVVNTASSEAEVDQELKAVLPAPTSEEMAKSRIVTFTSYVRRLGEAVVESGGSGHGRPKLGSIPFFLSYFWQIQMPATWPVFFTNSAQMMGDLNLWQPTNDLALDYIAFKHVHEELAVLFSREANRPFGLYDVEHVFWFKGGNPFDGDRSSRNAETQDPVTAKAAVTPTDATPLSILPDSYVPPIIQIIPRLAKNDASLLSAAKASGISISRALEKSIDAAFSILGYDAILLGQGQGRVPDGRAVDSDNSYAIIWDAKARSDRYSIGTDDRTIREYVVSQSRELRRRRGLRNVYYVIVSAEFADDFDDSVRSLKMETDISEVVLMEADALVAIVDAHLRAPREITLGPDGLQRLFTDSAVLTAATVREMLS